MQYGRLPNDILTIIDGYGRQKLTNTESIDRVYYDYHGKIYEEDYEIETEVMAK